MPTEIGRVFNHTVRMNDYQIHARRTAIYPVEHRVTYPLFGLIGEVGEYANKYKKLLRDGKEMSREDKVRELGDILWYVSQLCSDEDITLGEVAETNLIKLADRQARGVLGGSGDDR